ncbi:MAG TPA: DsbA family protein [Sporichthyaceae bacterium]|jgi:protein-disulfide isomerase-like protein with CxxC motif|nr:DsbA family protein [Sporichthyaceae bacterium]
MIWIEAVEITDPACGFAWGTEPKYRRLHWQYGELIRGWRRVMTGIFAPGWRAQVGFPEDEVAACTAYEAFLAPIAALTGMPYPIPVHHVMASSEDACRVAIAAATQGPAVGDAVLRRLRESWFVAGRPADTVERGTAAAAGVPGLDLDQLARDLADPATEKAWQADWEEARQPNDYVRNVPDRRPGMGAAQEQNGRQRYGLPCLNLTGPAGGATVAGWRDWVDWEKAIETVCPGAVAAARPLPTPAQAFATWPTWALAELDELCGPGAEPPAGTVEHRRPGGTMWLTEQEAAHRAP